MKTLAPAPTRRTGAWLEDPGFGVYVHIPFCAKRCHYCDFNTYEGQAELHESYVAALVHEIEATGTNPGPPATSVFFGGGTPTLLPPPALSRILRAVRDSYGLARDAEVTVEANPETVDEHDFEELLKAGFNRFSIGVQSLAPHVLAGLGRTHSGEVALAAFHAARSAGAHDVNLDLIFGSPWERPDDWTHTLDRVIEAGPDHVSAYALTIEEGTPLHTLIATGRVVDVDPDTQAERHETASRLLGAAGYVRYEVSNWAKPHRASRHNVLYWSAGNYIGFGAGAHSHNSGRRSWRMRLPRAYIAAVASGCGTEAGAEVLSGDTRAGEALMLGLRLTDGIDLPGFVRRFGAGPRDARHEAIATLVGAGLLRRDGARLKLARDAVLIANEVLCRLL
jgi:putative oxygen-independent coproporphyrinogen III oxidase